MIGRDSTCTLAQRDPRREGPSATISMTEPITPHIPDDGGVEEHRTAPSHPATTKLHAAGTRALAPFAGRRPKNRNAPSVLAQRCERTHTPHTQNHMEVFLRGGVLQLTCRARLRVETMYGTLCVCVSHSSATAHVGRPLRDKETNRFLATSKYTVSNHKPQSFTAHSV